MRYDMIRFDKIQSNLKQNNTGRFDTIYCSEVGSWEAQWLSGEQGTGHDIQLGPLSVEFACALVSSPQSSDMKVRLTGKSRLLVG